MTAGIRAWLDTAEAPLDLYDLLGSRCFEPDRDQLLQKIEAGISQLLPYRNDPSAERARRAVHLIQELNRARDTFSSPQRARAYDEGLMALIRAKCAALPASSSLQRDDVRQRLERDFRVHPERLEEVLEAVMPQRTAVSGAAGVGPSDPPPTAQGRDLAGSANQPVDAQVEGPPDGIDAPSAARSESLGPPPTAPKDAWPADESPTASAAHSTTPGTPGPRPPRPAPRTERKVAGARPHSAGQPPPSPLRKGESLRAPPMRHDATSRIGEIAGRAAPPTVGSSGYAMIWGVSAFAVLLVVGGAAVVLVPLLLQRNGTNRVAMAPPPEALDQGAEATDATDARDATADPTKSDESTRDPTVDARAGRPDNPLPADASPKTPDGSSESFAKGSPQRAEKPPLSKARPSAAAAAASRDGTRRDGAADDAEMPAAADNEKPPAGGDTKKPAPAGANKPPDGANAKPADGGGAPQGANAPVVLRHQGATTAVAWSPDANQLATTGMDRIVHIWNPTSGEELHKFEGHTRSVNSLCWDPEGKRLASASEDGTIRIWTIDGGASETLKPSGTAEKPLNAIAWSGNEDRLVAGSSDGTLSQWLRHGQGPWRSTELETGVKLGAVRSICCDDHIQLASCHGDAAIVIWQGRRVSRFILDSKGTVWEDVAKKPPPSLRKTIKTPSDRDGCTGMDVNHDGTLLAVASAGDLDIWSVAYEKINVRRQIIPGLPDLKGYRAPDWSPDGKYLAAGDGAGRVVGWEVVDGKVQTQRFQFDCPKAVVAVAWEPGKGHRLAAACEDGNVRIWKVDPEMRPGPFLNVEEKIIVPAKKFIEDESWEQLARAVALLRSQVLTPTQKLTVEALQAKLRAAADQRLAEVDVSTRSITAERQMELQAVIDLDPLSDAAAYALLLMQGKAPKTKRTNKQGAKAAAYAPEQATGPPDAKAATQDPAAWAPAASAAMLNLTFAQDVLPRGIEVHLNWKPDAVFKVSILETSNREEFVWVRNMPTRNSSSPLLIPLPAAAPKTRGVNVYVGGPCQIDAVCLVDVDGNKHWATNATASSTYSGR
jgi:WD40 repeat protein